MRTRHISCLGLAMLGIFSAPCTEAAAGPAPARVLPVRTIEQRSRPVVEAGTSEFTVRRLLGQPTRKLDRNTWVYRHYRPSDWKVEAGDCASLLISFEDGNVTQMRLVNDSAETAIAASLRSGPVPAAIAAK